MKIPRLALALTLLAVATLAPGLQAQEEKTTPLPWVLLTGSERKCIEFEQQIGGKICHKWDTAQRSFLIEKGGQIYLVVRTEQVDSRGPLTVPTVLSRSGQLPQPEIRSFRSLLAQVGIASLRGECNPFGNLFQTVPFQEGASYELSWNGPAGVKVKLPLASGFTGNPCPQKLLRLLHRINLISSGLPENPAGAALSN